MELVKLSGELTELIDNAKSAGKSVGFVPTMGALHQGHVSLVKKALDQNDFVVVSVFVNPLQFGEGEDFEQYPRAIGVDALLLQELEVDVLFAPTATEIYPAEKPVSKLSAGELGKVFEGAARPDHFDGMLTVVSRLFDLVRPDRAYFGQKDAQQVALVRRMLSEQIRSGFRSPITLIECETVRDEHGLALSSRNRFIPQEQLDAARSINLALKAAASEPDRERMLAAARSVLSAEAKLDYLELVDADSFEVLHSPENKRARLIIAVKLAGVRLIDNLVIDRTA